MVLLLNQEYYGLLIHRKRSPFPRKGRLLYHYVRQGGRSKPLPYRYYIRKTTKPVGDVVLGVPSKTQRNFINDGRIISSPTDKLSKIPQIL